MKGGTFIKQMAVAVAAAVALQTQAQIAHTVLDFGPGTYPYDVMVDPFNPTTSLFVASRAGSEVGTIWHVDLTQSPAGATMVDQYPGRIDQLGADSYSGALFSVGSVIQGSDRLWQVRRSFDQGATWTAAGPNYQYKAGAAAFGLGFASDNSGKVFACGYAYNRSGGNALWIVRRSSDQGASWSTYAIGKSAEDAAFAAHFVPDFGPPNRGGLFVVGRYNALWTVQRSRDGGNTWVTVDSWSASRNATSVARTLTSDAQGNLYVAGTSFISNKEGMKAFVRMSSNGGDSWQPILENFAYTPNNSGLAYSIDAFPINDVSVDAAGNLRTIGPTDSGDGTGIWTMLRRDSVMGWSIFKPYPAPSVGRKLTADALGNVYGLGQIQDVAGYWHCVLMQTRN